jgi:hypothetical protein
MALSADWNGRLRLEMIESHVNKIEVYFGRLMRKLRGIGKM